MAEASGIINRDGPKADDAFNGLLTGSSTEVREIAHAVRRLIFDVLPETVEVVWPKQGSVGWGTGPKKFSEQFAYVLLFKNHVTLGFYYGGELPDPSGLLPDSGGKQVAGRMSMRSLKLTALADVERPELRGLVEAATRHRVPPPEAAS